MLEVRAGIPHPSTAGMGLLARISWLEALDVIEAEVDGADFQGMSQSLVEDDRDWGHLERAPRRAIAAIARLERAARECPPPRGSPGLPTSTPGHSRRLFFPPQALPQPAGDETPIHEESEDEGPEDEHYDNGSMNMCRGHYAYGSVFPGAVLERCDDRMVCCEDRWRWGER